MLNLIIDKYQKKIGAYDKQQWETTVEQRILSGFTHVPKKTAKLKTELIDVDLVRGSAFTKTKPKHGILTVLRLAVFRLLLLPFYTGWWSKQTCFKFSILLLVLYVLQIINTCLYFTHIDSSDDTNERVSASEVLVPFVMMLALTVIHSLIISTSPECGSVAKSSQGQPSGRRVKRTKRRSAGYAGMRRTTCGGERVEETEPVEEIKYSKQRLAATHLHNSSSEEGGGPVSSARSRRVVVWDTTPVKTKAMPTVHADPLVQPDCKLREQLAGVDRINVPVAEGNPGPKVDAPPTPPHQDDDGFESLNGNEGSSDNIEEELAAPQPSCDKSGNIAVPSSCSTCDTASLQHCVLCSCDTKSGNSVSPCCNTCDTSNTDTPSRTTPASSCQCAIDNPVPHHCDKHGNSAAHAHCDIRLVPSCQDSPAIPPLSSCCDTRTNATPTHLHPHPPHLYLNQDNEHGSDILQITISEATPPRSSYSPLASPHCTERRYSAPPSCDLGADSEGSERREDTSPVVREKLLTRRRGSTQQLLTVSTGMKMKSGATGARSPLGGSSFNSDSEEGESHESFCPGLTEGTTSAGEWIGITTNSEECSYSDVSVSSGGERQILGGNMETDHPFAWEFEHSPSCILSPSCAASDKVSCTMWEKKDVKKADLSVLDISSAIIGRVELIPDNMDYFYTGMIMSTLLSFLPSLCRTCSVLFEDDALSTSSTSPYLSTSSTIDLSVNSTLGLISTWSNIIINAAFSSVLCERYVIIIGLLERLILGGFFFFLLTVAERTFKQRFLYAKFFSHLTSFRRARKSELPHFRLNKVRNIKTWLSVRSYLRKRGPQRSVDVIVTATFIITLLLLTFLSFEILKDSFRLHSTINVEALVWCLMLGVFLLRFMTLGTKINHKYRNMSVLITEQINLYLQIEQKPNKKDELMLANAVLKLAADLLKELESPFKISGLSANPYLYTITKVCILSALSGVLSELLGFKLKLHKIKIK